MRTFDLIELGSVVIIHETTFNGRESLRPDRPCGRSSTRWVLFFECGFLGEVILREARFVLQTFVLFIYLLWVHCVDLF